MLSSSFFTIFSKTQQNLAFTALLLTNGKTSLTASQAQQFPSLFCERQTNITSISNASERREAPPTLTSSNSSASFSSSSSSSALSIIRTTGLNTNVSDAKEIHAYDLDEATTRSDDQNLKFKLDTLQKHIASEVYKVITCFPQELANLVAQYSDGFEGNRVATFPSSSLVVLSNGYLASGAEDSSIEIWSPDINSNGQIVYRCSQTLTEHTNKITTLIELSNGCLASGAVDGTIKIWSPRTDSKGQLVYRCIQNLSASYRYGISTLIELSNGCLAAGCESITLWAPNADSNEQSAYRYTQTLEGHTGLISRLIALQNGCLASGSKDETIKIWAPTKKHSFWSNLWSLATGTYGKTVYQCTQTITEYDIVSDTLVILPNGCLASGSHNDTIKIWSPSTDSNEGTPYYLNNQTLRGHTDNINTLVVLSNGCLVSGSRDSSIKIWAPRIRPDGKTIYQCTQTLTGHPLGVNALALLTNGCLVSGCSYGTIKIWSPGFDSNGQATYQCIKSFGTYYNASIFGLVALPKNRLVSRSGNKVIEIWT